MRNFDWSDLDAHLLQLLVAVVEVGSITGAAQRLGVTQSAVSHLLDKLRAITGEVLFVKSGRGIVATARAESLAVDARELLRQLQEFAHSAEFDPARWRTTVTIAANDFQRDLLLPALAARLREAAPGVQLRVIPSAVPRLEMLRSDECQLAISPRPPDGTDVIQKYLFEDRYCVFYDPAQRNAPQDLTDYLAADHASVAYGLHRGLDIDQQLLARGIARRFAVLVPSFSALAAFVRGTQLLVTGPSLLGRATLPGLAQCPVPVACPVVPMYLIWHVRYQHDPANRWLRAQLESLVGPALGFSAGSPQAALNRLAVSPARETRPLGGQRPAQRRGVGA